MPRTPFILVSLGLAALAALAATGCTVEEVDLQGKKCPCADGWLCDEATNICYQPGSSGGTDGGLGGSSGSGGTSTGGTSGTGASGGTGGTGGASGGGGTGGTTTCTATQKLCGGACVSTSSASFGCAATSCDPCPDPAHSSPTCSAGACSILCSSNFGDCDSVQSNGCETALDSGDAANCGKCGRSCAIDNASATQCDEARCAPTCNAGFGNCNESSKPSPDDGCETNISTSTTHCGSCNNSCSQQGGGSAKFTCFDGACGCSNSSQCEAATGLKNVSCSASHGCVCDGQTCGKGEVCVKQSSNTVCSCNGGAACSSSQSCCAAGCKNLQTDAAHCGACGNACATGQTCVAGVCT